jgi:phage tail-like protein
MTLPFLRPPTPLVPLHVFRFMVDFKSDTVGNGAPGGPVAVCTGAFAECTGLEATMEPKAIREGGANYGVAQRAGPITFATVVLKRGISTNRDLWDVVFNVVAAGKFAPRLQVTITVMDMANNPVIAWQLDRAMPIKFKFADLNAKGTEVGIEELHLVHEGLSSESVGG